MRQASASETKPILVHGGLPEGLRVLPLTAHTHDRGSLTEIFRASWATGHRAAQWNHVTSNAGVMRGMHIHLGYQEYYVLLSGRTTIGYRDVRPGSPTEGVVAVLEVTGARPHAIVAPPGIAHGIYTHEPSVLLVGVTAEHDPSHELGCHWQDPALEIPWPMASATLSERDAAWPSLGDAQGAVPAWSAS